MKAVILLGVAFSFVQAQSFTITTFAGTGSFGYAGDGGPATGARLGFPSCLTVNAGNLYFADWLNSVIRVVTPNGNIATVAGNGTRGYSGDSGPAISAQLSYPCGLAFDTAGDLFIADTSNNVIREVTPDGNITTVAGNNTRGYTGDGGAATSATLYSPYALAVDAAGDIFFTDSGNHVVREVTNGNITTIAGTSHPGYSGDGGFATGAQFYYPRGLALDGRGNLYIADFGNSAIRKISAGSGVVTTVAGTGVAGFSGDNGPAINAGLALPQAVALDAAGNLLVTDTANQRIRMISSNGNVATIAGNGVTGYAGDRGAATSAEFFAPGGVAAGPNGLVYIADSSNLRIRLLTPITPGSSVRRSVHH